MIRRKLSEEIVQKDKNQIWNAFIDLIASEKEIDLTDIQKNAQRAFWYRFLSRELSLLFYAATNDSLLVLLGFKNTDSIRSHFLDSPDHLSGCLLFAAA